MSQCRLPPGRLLSPGLQEVPGRPVRAEVRPPRQDRVRGDSGGPEQLPEHWRLQPGDWPVVTLNTNYISSFIEIQSNLMYQ